MALTHSLGDTNLPLPKADEPFGMEYLPFGVALRTLDASYHVQLTGIKWKVRINWEDLTKAERDTLFGAYCYYLVVPGVYVMPDGLSLSVMTGLGSWVESPTYEPWQQIWRYACSFTVEQV
jgi:hypothetical protein